jgi:hypothetical protein
MIPKSRMVPKGWYINSCSAFVASDVSPHIPMVV